MCNVLKILLLILVLNVINPPNAYAYLDPNTGSMVVQTIIACITAIGFTFGMWKKSVIDFFKKLQGKKNDEN